MGQKYMEIPSDKVTACLRTNESSQDRVKLVLMKENCPFNTFPNKNHQNIFYVQRSI